MPQESQSSTTQGRASQSCSHHQSQDRAPEGAAQEHKVKAGQFPHVCHHSYSAAETARSNLTVQLWLPDWTGILHVA
ncbi:rCG55337, isoform CRA_a [Rattus norvegicus]|uniref:RCG55337, isoform CRA_a n=1 Tax=Rattus norvegicus TaxID=10116 RepID=A6KF43_RAT|nr:rCG55337, isoform CRA_a [Rattus norvegicus]EDL91581.1 rCG55337, isoform CRA_a [Rattus norvegicus]